MHVMLAITALVHDYNSFYIMYKQGTTMLLLLRFNGSICWYKLLVRNETTDTWYFYTYLMYIFPVH